MLQELLHNFYRLVIFELKTTLEELAQYVLFVFSST